MCALAKKEMIATVLIFALMPQICFADIPNNPLGLAKDVLSGPSEYIYRRDPADILMPVYILGAVAKPGLYEIPPSTDMVTLLALAGGPTENATLSDVTLKHPQTAQSAAQVYQLDMHKVLSGSGTPTPILSGNDVVYVKPGKNWISPDTMAIVSIATAVATLFLSGIAVAVALRH